MEIIYFSMGVLSTALAYAVVGVFKLRKQVDFLKIDIDQLHNIRKIEVDELHRRIDTCEASKTKDVDELHRRVDTCEASKTK